MKYTLFGLITAFSLLQSISAKARELPDEELSNTTSGLYAGGQAATSGFGVNIRYILSDRFTLKTGVETLNFNRNFEFDENDITYDASLDYKTGGIFVLADFFYLPSLYVSAGAGLNQFNPNINGNATSDLEYGDITVPKERVGNFDFDVKPSQKISPYAGIGYRKFFGKNNRIVYNFETGLYYMGAPEVEIYADGLLSPTASPEHGKKELFEKQLQEYKYYPVVKVNLAVKLF